MPIAIVGQWPMNASKLPQLQFALPGIFAVINPYPSHPQLCRKLIGAIGEYDDATPAEDAIGALLSAAATIAAYNDIGPDVVQHMLTLRLVDARRIFNPCGPAATETLPDNVVWFKRGR